MRYIIALLALFLPSMFQCVAAQTLIRGEVVQVDNRDRIEGVMLYLIDAGSNKSISITQSDANGDFVFKASSSLVSGQPLLVRATRIGYKPLQQSVEYKEGMMLQLKMEATSYELKELEIKAPKIREIGDTIVYRTSAFALKQDETLSQVLERMPGLEVVGGGQIKYEGKSINKFYIEQMDLLGRRYSIASNSLRPEDVAAVEVYRNHEPIRMLAEHSLSDRAALNIRLTNKAKGRWLAWLSVGVGMSPLLYDLNSRAMRFSATTQAIYLIKGNNTGRDMSAELRAHEQSVNRKLTFSLSDYASPDFYQSMGEALKYSPIGKRQRFNRSFVLSGNQLIKLGEFSFLRINAIYSDEYFDSSRDETIDFSMPDGSRKVLGSEQKYFVKERNMLLEADYEYNGNDSFFNNKTKLNRQSNSSRSILAQDSQPFEQNMSLPYFRIENNTEYHFRLGGSTVALENVVKYLYRNQSLAMSLPLSQAINSRLVDNSFAISTHQRWDEHQLNNTLQWDIQYHDIGVQSVWGTDDSFEAAKYLSNSISLAPKYSWKSEGWDFSAELPIGFYIYRYPHINKNYLKADFYIRGGRYWSNNLKLEGSYRYYHNMLGATGQFPGLKVLDSRRITEVLHHPYQGYSHSSLLSMSYTVPMSGTAITATSNLIKSKRWYTSSSFVQDGFIIHNQIQQPSSYTFLGTTARVAQTFWQGKIDATIRGAYNRKWSEILVQKQEVPLVSDNYSIGIDLSLRLSPDIKLDYYGSIVGNEAQSSNKIPVIIPKLLTQVHKGSLIFWLSDKWSSTIAAEFHNTLQGNRDRYAKAGFLDFGIKYHGKKVSINLDFSNVTNQKYYETISVSEAQSIRVVTPLRPFEVLMTFALGQ